MRSRPSRPRVLVLTGAALLALTLGATADLDVDVPPGVALSWPRPRPAIVDYGELSGGRESKPEPKQGQGSIDVVDKPGKYVERPTQVSRLDGVFRLVGIITFDLPGHLPWSRPGPPAGGRALIRPPASARATGWRYPPVTSPHLHWFAVALLLRPALHPSVVSMPAAIEHLIAIGYPAAEATRGARDQPGELGRLAKMVHQHVGDPPPRVPAPSGAIGVEAEMLHALALYELVSSAPDDPERPFARRLLSLGHEAVPPLLHYSKSAHPVIRRSAVAALGRLGHPKGDERLRALIADADRVVRNRAVLALAHRRDREAVPPLVALLAGAGNDRGTLALAAWALGRIGDPRAEAPLLRALQTPGREQDGDALWPLLAALARMPGGPAARAAIDRLDDQLRRAPARYDTTALIEPTSPHKVRRAEILRELCRLARIRWGDARAATAWLDELDKARRSAGRAAGRRHGPEQRRGRVLYGVLLPNLELAIETLARLGEPGNRVLERVIEEEEAHATLRGLAMEHIRLSGWMSFVETPAHLAQLAREHELGLVRERALRRLAQLDESLAGDVAVELLREYADGNDDIRKLEQNLVIMPALAIIGRLKRGRAIAAELVQALQREREERADLEQQRARHWADPNARNPLDMTMVTIPPFLELALLEVARSGGPQARAELLAQLGDGSRPARAEAAIGLGALDGAKVRQALVAGLRDLDPWVRFCCYRALRRLTGNNDPSLAADWIHGLPAADLKAAHAGWRKAIRAR